MNALIQDVAIKAIAACVPKNEVITEDKRFAKLTGIKARRIAPEGMNASDLGLKAAKELDLKDVKFVIFCSQTHDHYIPFVSNWLVKELELPSDTGTLDLIGGCAGFIQGLYTSFSISKTMNHDVLFVIGDTLSRTTGEHDPGSMGIFGDAAAAVIVGYEYMSDTEFSLNSEYSEAIRMTGGYNDQPDKQKLYMDGEQVMDFALMRVKEMINNSMFDNYIFHQSNMMILTHFKNYIPDFSNMPVNIDRFGNTSGASIPLAIVTENVSGFCNLIGYGSGLTWGNCETHIGESIQRIFVEL